MYYKDTKTAAYLVGRQTDLLMRMSGAHVSQCTDLVAGSFESLENNVPSSFSRLSK